MRNVTIKGLLAHKLRLALTALAIVLGVTFICGTFVWGGVSVGGARAGSCAGRNHAKPPRRPSVGDLAPSSGRLTRHRCDADAGTRPQTCRMPWLPAGSAAGAARPTGVLRSQQQRRGDRQASQGTVRAGERTAAPASSWRSAAYGKVRCTPERPDQVCSAGRWSGICRNDRGYGSRCGPAACPPAAPGHHPAQRCPPRPATGPAAPDARPRRATPGRPRRCGSPAPGPPDVPV